MSRDKRIFDLEECLIAFAVRIIRAAESLPKRFYRIKGVIFHWLISGYKFNPPQWKSISFLKRSLLR